MTLMLDLAVCCEASSLSFSHRHRSFPLDTLQQIQNADCDDGEEMCIVLKKLFRGLPEGTIVFCIVDSIMALETRVSCEAGAAAVVDCLVGLSDDGEASRRIVKVLFTSASRSKILLQRLDTSRVLTLPQSIPPAGRVPGDFKF